MSSGVSIKLALLAFSLCKGLGIFRSYRFTVMLMLFLPQILLLSPHSFTSDIPFPLIHPLLWFGLVSPHLVPVSSIACQALMGAPCNQLFSAVKRIKLALQKYIVVSRGHFAVLVLVVRTCPGSTWSFSRFARLLLKDGGLSLSFPPLCALPLSSVRSLRRLRVLDAPFDVAVPYTQNAKARVCRPEPIASTFSTHTHHLTSPYPPLFLRHVAFYLLLYTLSLACSFRCLQSNRRATSKSQPWPL
jgi:hypothetical protein